ncbi:MAG: leucine--tRNA ligase [Candidatus Cloacimonadota bacterium]|nr:MAG: leucine--tRNA ligase [Candidatus Cloacimonadota bacterium]
MKDNVFKEIEKKWQERWEELKLYKTVEKPEKKFYLLEMYAYPSGDIHLGHFRNYTLGDVVWRYKKMKGYQIFHPFGWDAFGLPAEQAAITNKASPSKWTHDNIEKSKETLQLLGISYDWEREIATCDPNYYKWTQWLFKKLYEHGLCYRARTFVNWCPDCKTVLANEQVIQGKCWRCDSLVTKKETEQWFIKITDYAERLLNGIEKLDEWPENVKTIQRNWLGKSEGSEIVFKLEKGDVNLPVFTTRSDTIYGVTFIVIAPEHRLLRELLPKTEKRKEVEDYINKSMMKTEIERTDVTREKDGIFTGLYAINPFSEEKVEIWTADYVLSSYGTGVVMAVPAHDQRDFEFAKKYHLHIKIVINPPGEELTVEKMENAYTEPGIMVNSGPFSGMDSVAGIEKTIEYMEEKEIGKRKIAYRIRDWLISRQRYWGAPIPMVHCEKCGTVPVPENHLPVFLPEESKVDFIPKGRSPLADVPEFYYTKCPKCKGKAYRDVDTIDTFLDSSWYYLRYLSPKDNDEIFRKEEAEKWFPVDLYIGGIEHAAGHLIYYRFITMFLYDIGLLPSDEPTIKLFNHGMVLDEKGEVMSKSKGNVVSPRELIEKDGVDVSRVALLFFAPPAREILYQKKGLKGARRFLKRIYRLAKEHLKDYSGMDANTLNKMEYDFYRAVEETICDVTVDIERIDFNTAIASLMELLNRMCAFEEKDAPIFQYAIRKFNLLLAPFAPHLAEELYSWYGKSETIFNETWPTYDENAIKKEEVTIVIQINGKVRSRIVVPANSEEEDIKHLALEEEKIKKYTEGKEIKKFIYVKDKLLNIVL